jgi:hypothetical protein
MEIMKNKLLGIYLISAVDLLVGTLSFSVIIGVILGGCKLSVAFLNLFLGLFMILTGFLTLRLNPKSVICNIILSVFGIMASIGAYGLGVHELRFTGELCEVQSLYIFCLVSIIYFVWVIVYLKRLKVKEQFK